MHCAAAGRGTAASGWPIRWSTRVDAHYGAAGFADGGVMPRAHEPVVPAAGRRRGCRPAAGTTGQPGQSPCQAKGSDPAPVSDFQRGQIALRLQPAPRSEARFLASSMSISERVCSPSSTVSCTRRRVSGWMVDSRSWFVHLAQALEAGDVDRALDLLALDLVQHRTLFFLVQGVEHLLAHIDGTAAASPRRRGRHRPAPGSASGTARSAGLRCAGRRSPRRPGSPPCRSAGR